MNEALLPCPLCGRDDLRPTMHRYAKNDRRWHILCERADHHFFEATGHTRGGAIAAWNTRALATLDAATESMVRDAYNEGFAAGRGSGGDHSRWEDSTARARLTLFARNANKLATPAEGVVEGVWNEAAEVAESFLWLSEDAKAVQIANEIKSGLAAWLRARAPALPASGGDNK